jgi:hypothetical protein
MSKELPFFKFNATQWLTGNINYESFHTQGVFIRVCAEYWNRSNEMSYEDIVLRVNDSTTIDYLIEKEYIKLKNKKLCIKFLDEEKIEINSKRLKLSEAGRKGGLSSVQARLKQGSSIKEEDKDKEEDIRKEIKAKAYKQPLIEEVITYFTDNGYREDIALRAFEYYNVAQWKDSNGKQVRNWKQKMNSVWFKDENKKINEPKKFKSVDDIYAENVMRQMEENQRRNDTSRRT